MLNEVVVACAFSGHIGNELAYHIELMESREDETLPVVLLLKVDELLYDVHHRVLLEDVLPEVCGRVAVRVGRIALATIVACSVRSLVERKEVCVLACKLRRHPHLGMVDAEVGEDPLVELEAYLTRVAVVHPLSLRVVHRLTGVLVLQLESEDRDAVEHKHHVHGLLCVGGVVPLPVAFHGVCCVELGCGLVQC